MPVGHQKHRGVPVAPTVFARCGHQPFDLGLCEVLAGPQGAVGGSVRPDCSIYSSWRDKFEVRVDHAFGAFPIPDCSYKGSFTNSRVPTVGLLRPLVRAILQWTKLGRAVRIISKPRLTCALLPVRPPTSHRPRRHTGHG